MALVGLVLGGYLVIRFWYVAIALVAVLVLVYGWRRVRRAKRARHRSGHLDAWLNEVNVASVDLGLREYSRNQVPNLAGVAARGDITLRKQRFAVRVTMFPDARRAHEAEIGLLANEKTRGEVRNGKRALTTRDRVVFDATGRGRAVDEFLLDEVVRLVDRLPVPGLRASAGVASPIRSEPQGDALRQIRELAALRDSGAVTVEEFEDKKTSLLKRL